MTFIVVYNDSNHQEAMKKMRILQSKYIACQNPVRLNKLTIRFER